MLFYVLQKSTITFSTLTITLPRKLYGAIAMVDGTFILFTSVPMSVMKPNEHNIYLVFVSDVNGKS